jgi:hypothetical protein
MKLKREVEAELHAFLTLILPVHKMKSPGWNATGWKTLLSILKKKELPYNTFSQQVVVPVLMCM